MQKKPILLVLAAGMGSRYGGLKQMDAMGENGEVIIDYSIYDAIKAGFERAVVIIKHEIEKDFKELVGNRLAEHIELSYAYQELDKLPEGFALPEGRVKPWGTSHAVMCAKDLLDAPFAVINADDFYGRDAFKTIYNSLMELKENQFSMVGYTLGNTLTEHGTVARGVCDVDRDGMLTKITERTKIERYEGSARFTEDGGESFAELPLDTPVSMNFWGFEPGILPELEKGFVNFLKTTPDIAKAEYILPMSVDELISSGKASVKVLHSSDRWFGVTYHEDKAKVVAEIKALHQSGVYPAPLWS